MLKCGLLGKTLGHSYSPRIHRLLGSYEYQLYEKQPEELEDFLLNGDWDGLNVTIPYKKEAFRYCSRLSETAKGLGSVNTLVRLPDGSICGDNTDVYGFSQTVRLSGIRVRGKKTLVFGNGGAAQAVLYALRQLGAETVVISRSGENNYENLHLHLDAQILVNTTPVGMYPNTGEAVIDVASFPKAEAVFDIVYNPARTELLLQAERLGIPCFGGLYMLVAQAKKSSEQFAGKAIDDKVIGRITEKLSFEMQNIVLIGMPGCGKSRIGRLLAEKTGRRFVDADAELVKAAGRPIPQIFAEDGEEVFRELETKTLQQLGKQSGLVIATGGGCVTRERNYPLLHQNGRIVCLVRDLDKLAVDGRPISLSKDVHLLYQERKDSYRAFADVLVDNNEGPQACVKHILEVL
ncbi:MAG: shikimate kinase [Firmicutes bacterium]|nr:shikimate kinase [Bacillota bacterium]